MYNTLSATRRRARGWTLIELLVAMAVISTFLAGIMIAFIQILRASDRSERMVQAYENARAAVDTISLNVKAAYVNPSKPAPFFRGINIPTLEGNRTDDDSDGFFDEEQPNGLDDDGDFDAARDDRHAVFGSIVERPAFVGKPDLGDAHVDEDPIFHRDQLMLATFPGPTVAGGKDQLTTFSIEPWEGESNVLLQRTLRDTGIGGVGVAPLAYDVLSLNLLYWDPNRSPAYWVEQWDARQAVQNGGSALPAAVYCSVTVYAGRVPLEKLGPNDPIESVTVSTVVNIESVIHSPKYELLRASQ